MNLGDTDSEASQVSPLRPSPQQDGALAIPKASPVPRLLRWMLTRTGLSLLVGAALTCAGCSASQRPSGPPPPRAPAVTYASTAPAASEAPASTDEKGAVRHILETWQHTAEWTGASLSHLDWHLLKKGTTLAENCVLITDKDATVLLRVPLTMFKGDFIDRVRGGRILGYTVFGDSMELEVAGETLYPVRPNKQINAGPTYQAVAFRVSGTAIYTADRDKVARDYGKLEAHNPPYPPASDKSPPPPVLPPRNVEVSKGLGVRGKDVQNLAAADRAKRGLTDVTGVYVDAVIPGSPADQYGVKAYDVITNFDHKPIASPQDLMDAIEAARANNDIDVEVVRTINSSLKPDEVPKTETVKLLVQVKKFTGNANALPSQEPSQLPAGAP